MTAARVTRRPARPRRPSHRPAAFLMRVDIGAGAAGARNAPG